MKLRRLASLLLCTSLWSCASTPTVAPTVSPTPLSIRTVPAIVMSYSEIRVTCQLPTDLTEEGDYMFGIVDMFSSAGPIDRIQFSRELIAPCEPFKVFCGYQEHGKKAVMTTSEIIPVGDCR